MATSRADGRGGEIAALEEKLDAMTLTEAWPVIQRAWLDRRRNPNAWRLIANNVTLVRYMQGERS